MWKGVLLGILLFIVGGISYAGIRVGIVLYRLGQQVKTGTITRGDGGAQWDIRIWLGLLHSPVFLGCVPGSDCNCVVDYERTSDSLGMSTGWEWLKKENGAPSYNSSFAARWIALLQRSNEVD